MTLRLFNPLRKGPTLRGFDWLLRLSMRGTLWNSVPSDAGSALLKTLYQSVGMAHYCLALFPWSTRSTSVIFSLQASLLFPLRDGGRLLVKGRGEATNEIPPRRSYVC